MVGGLLGLRSEDTYSRARKVLKERFGDSFKIYEAYREKLKAWPVSTTGGELQVYSDFLVMTILILERIRHLFWHTRVSNTIGDLLRHQMARVREKD